MLADHRLLGGAAAAFLLLGCGAVCLGFDGRPDLALFFLDDGGCRSPARIWESEVLGRGPGRWVIADGFILFFGTCVYFDSFSSQRATGLLRLKVVLIVFFGGGDQRRGRRVSVVR